MILWYNPPDRLAARRSLEIVAIGISGPTATEAALRRQLPELIKGAKREIKLDQTKSNQI